MLNVCTGERRGSLQLTIKAAEELAGAAILVDGKEVARLSSGPGYEANIGLSSGAHEIRVKRKGYQDIVVPVDYGPEVTEDTVWIRQLVGEQ